MMKVSILLFLLAISVLADHQHDQIQGRIQNRETSNVSLDDQAQTNLQSSNPRKMKITYDMSFFNKLTGRQDLKQQIEKAIQIAINYFSELLTIVPKPAGAMYEDKKSDFCSSSFGIDQESDLHLNISYINYPNVHDLGFADWCRFLYTYGPSHGYVAFNIWHLDRLNLSDPIAFQDFIQATIKFIIPTLGSSIRDVSLWVDTNKQPYVEPTVVGTARGMNVTYIQTPNVQQTARDYYGCTSIPGMLLENRGFLSKHGSFLESTIILDEIMTHVANSSETNFIISVFTIALLKDTGFFASVKDEFTEPSYFGKDQGCDFILGECDSTKREFCSSKKLGCDYYSHGIARCFQNYHIDNGCQIWQVPEQTKCFNEKNFFNTPENVEKKGFSFGTESKCFMSSLILNRYEPTNQAGPGCFTYECTADQRIIVNIGSEKITCSQNGQRLTLDGYSGQFTCPEKLDEFCGFKKMCPNHCSMNGYCINGTCLCRNGKETNDCS